MGEAEVPGLHLKEAGHVPSPVQAVPWVLLLALPPFQLRPLKKTTAFYAGGLGGCISNVILGIHIPEEPCPYSFCGPFAPKYMYLQRSPLREPSVADIIHALL